MTQITTQYAEGSNRPVRADALEDNAFFRLPESQTVWRVLGSIDYQNVRVLNLDDLQMESFGASHMVTPVEVNAIEVRVEFV